MISFEQGLQTKKENPENEEFKERLSIDYQNIRKEALDILEQKIVLMKDKLGADDPEVAKYEAAKEKLNDDQWILNLAKVNNWERSRARAEDQEEEAKKLSRGLVETALNLH